MINYRFLITFHGYLKKDSEINDEQLNALFGVSYGYEGNQQ